MQQLHEQLQVNILAIEYPEYQQFYMDEQFNSQQPESSVEQILDDILQVYSFIIENVGILNKEIILFGRSIGSGFVL
jgi:hypothetical protein